MQKKLGNGANTSFWEDVWRGNMALKYRYPRLYALELNKKIDVAAKIAQASLVDMGFRRIGRFSVVSVRKLLDDKRLSDISFQTRWIKAVPIKVNIHAWKVRLDCLPTRLNISRRGMDIAFILCPICGSAVESSSHLFFDGHVAKDNF
ncbi:RNA-directed DNA polymerase, eukaryota, reverse transcriptase zinc-binding domain protein [Tanacetum coccineum]